MSAARVVNGVDLNGVDDCTELQDMLDQLEMDDFDGRKEVRARIREIKEASRAERDERFNRMSNAREEGIKRRQKEAVDRNKRTLQMFDQMAKSAPAGGNKVMDINIYKKSFEGSPPQSGRDTLTNAPPTRDLVEESIRERKKDADDRKKRILAAFDAAAKTGPSGPKDIDFVNFKEPDETKSTARSKFQMDGTTTRTTMTSSSTRTVGGSTGGGITRSASDVKEMLLLWCKAKTKEYPNVQITNFSSSWADGMAFCALIHHFYPDSFDFESLDPKKRRHNFEVAFSTAEEKGNIAPLLEVDDMILMKNKPDWKCVFTYVQSIYRKLRDLD